MGDLGLNESHQSVILNYMKFTRYLRTQTLKQIEHLFVDVLESRLLDDTYTLDEVKELLNNLQQLIMCDMETEFISYSHNNVLMLQQLFTQAEKWHLRLQIDLSELQNQELLEMIKTFENDEKGGLTKINTQKLQPIEQQEEGSIALLRMEIERLKEDNEKLANIIQDTEDRADLYREEKNKLNDKLTNAQKEMRSYKLLAEQSRAPDNTEFLDEMEAKLNTVEVLLSSNLEESESKQEKLKMELNYTKEKVQQVEAQLQLAELELERKFSETKAYANMKQILMKKNEQIKELRIKLQDYQPELDDNAED